MGAALAVRILAADPAGEASEADARYPLALLSPATHRTINSMFGEFQPPPAAVTVHPDDAGARGLVEGDGARVWNDLAAIELVVRVTTDVRPGVVVIPKGLWRKDRGKYAKTGFSQMRKMAK